MDEYDPYDYRETDDWFNEPLPPLPTEPKYKLWQVDTPLLPLPKAPETNNASTVPMWLLIIAIFFAMMVLVALTN